MQSMTTSEIHGYLSQSMFTTSKKLCNFSIFCRYLDTLFKTVHFKTGQNLDHSCWKEAVFDRQMNTLEIRQIILIVCRKCVQFHALCCLFAALLPTIQKWYRTALAVKCACMKEKYM